MNLNETTFPFFSLSTIVATLKHLDFPVKSGFVYLAFEICLPFRSVILNFEYSRKQRKTLKTLCFQGLSGGLGERIRTSGLLNPIQARYQTAPHPVDRTKFIIALCVCFVNSFSIFSIMKIGRKKYYRYTNCLMGIRKSICRTFCNREIRNCGLVFFQRVFL